MAGEGIATTAYASHARKLIQLISELRTVGASTELDLPRIATAGSQSAGKSSSLEAISGVKVPRDAGTCTRCPMEVRLRHSTSPWSCRIFLRFETGVDGKPLETVREIPFGETLTDPNAVEAALRRAQLAVLNPSVKSVEYFLEMDDATVRAAKEGTKPPLSKEQLSFSTNLVCLDISGPSIVDLAFVDLPGIISNSPDPSEIELVEKMTIDAIKGQALILLAVTMRDDYQNQKAVLLAQQADPEGKRTIGVLTKADLVQEGEFKSWIDMLEGRKNQLTHGFFATKQPAPADLQKNLSFLDARAAEVEFFKTTAPWSNLSLASKERLGIANLTKVLSERLAEAISEQLPSIHAQVAESLTFVNKSINDLPPPPAADLVAELHIHLANLRSNLESLVRGSSGFGELIREKNKNDKRYKQAIRATRPAFVPFDSKDGKRVRQWEKEHEQAVKRRKGRAGAAINASQGKPAPFVFGSPAVASPTGSATAASDKTAGFADYSLSGSNGAGDALSNSLTALSQQRADKEARIAQIEAGLASDDEDDEGIVASPSLKLKLDEVRQHIAEHKARELPMNTPYEARASLMVDALAGWPELTIETAEKLRKPLTVSVDKLVATYFRNSELRGKASMVTAEVLDELFKSALARLQDHLDLEAVPFTQNSHYFQTTRDATMADYKSARQTANVVQADEEKLNAAFSALAALGLKGLEVEDLARLHKPDEWEEELEAMAQAVAYWKVAYKRIIDDVPRILDASVIRPLPNKLGSALVAKLTAGGDSEIKRLMAESPAIAEQRADLLARRSKLEDARKVLSAFGGGL